MHALEVESLNAKHRNICKHSHAVIFSVNSGIQKVELDSFFFWFAEIL